MKKIILERAGGLLAIAMLFTASWPAQVAAQTQPAMSCDQMSAEIQAISEEMQGSTGALQSNMAEQMRAQQRQMTASALAGAIPIPIVGSVAGQAAGAADRRRVAELQQQQQATYQNYLARLPEITGRLQTLAVQFERQCLSGATPGGSGSAGPGDS